MHPDINFLVSKIFYEWTLGKLEKLPRLDQHKTRSSRGSLVDSSQRPNSHSVFLHVPASRLFKNQERWIHGGLCFHRCSTIEKSFKNKDTVSSWIDKSHCGIFNCANSRRHFKIISQSRPKKKKTFARHIPNPAKYLWIFEWNSSNREIRFTSEIGM